jgi:hypothetical protein
MRHLLVAVVLFLACARAQADPELAQRLQQLDAAVLPLEGKPAQMLGHALKARRNDANLIESKTWLRRIHNRSAWEAYRDVRIAALRRSLGRYPAAPADLKVKVTRTLTGEGYAIDNLVFESRPGLIVTANLYRPVQPPAAPPAFLIIPSHHNPKTQGELQDMGMTWARLGCLVLVADELGHGERRQHPFVNKQSYDGDFKVGRQDYYFRYNTSLQLYLIGDSLMGWMAWDAMRCVDLLLQKGCDRERIILLGSVAAGGDCAAVTAALDRRIAVVVPFNFGGAQPETVYPLPADAETSFNYVGGGSWESTRNLAFSAHDGFLPWVIVGSVAPRALIHAHEFAWDRDRDPVWKRYQAIYQFYQAPERLASTHGSGSVRGKSKNDTHCNNIGPVHRKAIYVALQQWFAIPTPPAEYQNRHPGEDLQCLPVQARPLLLHQLAGQLASERLQVARKKRESLPPAEAKKVLRERWADRLGWVQSSMVKGKETATALGEATCVRTVLTTDGDIEVPLALLLPRQAKQGAVPVVVAVAQAGKHAFLKHRSEIIAKLLNEGVAVCLPDVRGTGETRPGNDRGRTSGATSQSAMALMLGEPLLGGRLRDLRGVLAYLRQRSDIDGKKIALWGDSFAPVNPPDRNLRVPWDAARLPDQAEPLGGLLALFGALYEDDVQAVYVRGGLVSFQSILDSEFLYVPHDVIVPGALTVSDLVDVAAALAPRALRLEGLVDGRNVRVTREGMSGAYELARRAFGKRAAESRFQMAAVPASDRDVAEWLLTRCK